MRTLEMKEHLLEVCKKRNYDEWALRVRNHLLECHDLVAAEGCYTKRVITILDSKFREVM